jgi:hypothetical protein
MTEGASLPHPLRATACLSDEAFATVRRALVLDHCKWDAQVGDVEALARFALVIRRDAWQRLAKTSEALAAELEAIEKELVSRTELHETLGLPRPLRDLFRHARTRAATPCAVRVMRFDFHWTGDRFTLSEVNADVPGGYAEASAFPALVAPHLGGLSPVGDPAAAWADAMADAALAELPVALLAAPGFLEDTQVIAHLAGLLRARGLRTVLGHARHVFAPHGDARFESAEYAGPVGAIVRFYQSEWLGRLRSLRALEGLFVGGRTPVAGPGTAVLTESKRVPLVCSELRAECAVFVDAMPESRDPRAAPWLRQADEWALKGTYSNTGDQVVFPDRLSGRARLGLAARVSLDPTAWVAQRRFTTALVATPLGDVRPCIGVYTVDGDARGAYARLATRDIVDAAAVDVPLLLEA